jgi:hypothetical protein
MEGGIIMTSQTKAMSQKDPRAARGHRLRTAVIAGAASALMAAGAFGVTLNADAADDPVNATTFQSAFTSEDKWAGFPSGDYAVRNNVWGSGAGSQSIWANSGASWGVTADHPNTGGVKSYPHSGRDVNRKLSELGHATSNFAVDVPGEGAHATAYDIWANGTDYEIMLWMNGTDNIGPIGAKQTTADVGGHTWDVHKGTNGSNEVFSFVRTSDTNSGSVDLLAVLNWIKDQGWYGDVTVRDVQFGFEITSSAGGLNFTCNDYSVSFG